MDCISSRLIIELECKVEKYLVYEVGCHEVEVQKQI